MKRSVHNFISKQILPQAGLISASVRGQLKTGKGIFLTMLGMALMLTASAQTYTTKQDGNWSSSATWVGGSVPSRTISSGMTVNILHDVTGNVGGDINISGVLNITNDTLRFASSWSKKVVIKSTGQLNITNGGFIQDVVAQNAELENDGGRFRAENAYVSSGKDFMVDKGSKSLLKNSTLIIAKKYEIDGSTSEPSKDTIQNSTIKVLNGDFIYRSTTHVMLANASITVSNGKLDVDGNATISTLTVANSNFAINSLKISNDLKNDAPWNARIDAFCIDGNIDGNKMAEIDFTRPEDCSLQPINAPAPELSFSNPVLKSGQHNKPGAIYRFADVYPGVDAEVKIKKFSRNDIVFKNIDVTSFGWQKALQPEFGLAGNVLPYQNWYVDFELVFYNAGTNVRKTMQKVDLTALDVDGDSKSVMEYATFQNPTNVVMSTVSYLSENVNILTGASLACSVDNLISPMIPCVLCGGDGKTGYWNWYTCGTCKGTGNLFSLCNHSYDGTAGNILQGPVDNFVNIDTAATQVMAIYQYFDVDEIKFRYGAKSGSKSSNGAGIRLNSLWFRRFDMSPAVPLPVDITAFHASYDRKNVNLTWSALEEDFSHYALQRSADGKEFSDIAIVMGKENHTDAENKYEYLDKNVSSASGMLFYRLQMIDKTKEAARTSEIKVVKLNQNSDAIALSTYPNPVQNELRVTLPASWQGKVVSLELYSSTGARVQGMAISNASNTETMEVGKIAKGFYLVKASCEGQVAQQRVVKQ